MTICPPTKVFEVPEIHPSECRSFAYSQHMRSQAIDTRLCGQDGPANINIRELHLNRLYPSEMSVDRWMTRRHDYGHIRAFRRTGNRRSQREIKQERLILLALHRAALPKATMAELNAFLFSMNLAGPNNCFYSYSQQSHQS